MPNITQTATYDQPALAYNPVPGMFVAGSPNPYVIQLILQTYSGITAKGTLNTISSMPIVRADQGGFAYGGIAISEGATELPRLSIGGYIDTTWVEVNNSGVLMNAVSVTWADFIIACMEGRVSNTWQRYDPLWFRDPFGRQFNNVRIIDFQASYVEAVPNRTTFSATLLAL